MRRWQVLLLLAVLVLAPVAGVQGSGIRQLTERAYLPLVPLGWTVVTGWDYVDASINVVNMAATGAWVRMCFHYWYYGDEFCPLALATSEGSVSNPFQLPVDTSVEILPFLTGGLGGAGLYSAVVFADQDVAAIVNLSTWIARGGTPYYNASYNGTPADGVSVRYAPSVVQSYYDWDCEVVSQNMANSAQYISGEFFTEGSSTVCNSGHIDSLPRYTASSWLRGYSLPSACDADGDGYNGAARFSAIGPVAVAVFQVAWESVYGPAGRAQAYSGFGPGATVLYAPALYYGYYGWDSSINVQNQGLNDTTVQVIYSDGYVASHVLPSGASHLFYQWEEGQAGHHTPGSKFSASIVSGGELIIAVVNAATTQAWPGNWAPRDQAQTYSAPSYNESATTVVFPQIMREYYGWYTSYTIQNVGPNMTNVLVSYSGVPECQDLVVGPIAPGANVEIYQGGASDGLCPSLPGSPQPGNPNAAGYRGAVTAQVAGPSVIVGIVNQSNFYHRVTAGETGDWSMAYNGLGK
jgi:hypothetical protein